MKQPIVIPSDYGSFLFDQRSRRGFLSAARLIDENDPALRDHVLSAAPPAWLPPFRPLCQRCLLHEAKSGENCFLCSRVLQKEKSLFEPSGEHREDLPGAALWIYCLSAEDGVIPTTGTALSFGDRHFCLFCKRNEVYDRLLNESWPEGVNQVVVELNRTVMHIGNTLRMARHHAVHMPRADGMRVKFIFSDAQLYASEFIYDPSFLLSREDLTHMLPGVDEIGLNFDHAYLEQMIAYFHEDRMDQEYLKNKMIQLCTQRQKAVLFRLNLFEMPRHFALLLLKLARMLHG